MLLGLSKLPMFGRTVWSDDMQAQAIIQYTFYHNLLWLLMILGLSKLPMFGRTVWSDDVQAQAIMDIIQEFKLTSVKGIQPVLDPLCDHLNHFKIYFINP